MLGTLIISPTSSVTSAHLDRLFKEKLKRKGIKLDTPKENNTSEGISDYMVEAITRICDGRMDAGNMLIGTKISHLSDTRYVSNYFNVSSTEK